MQSTPAVACDGTNYLVTWVDGGTSVVGARVSPAGSVLDPAAIPVLAGTAPAVAYNGTAYLVAAQTTAANSDIVGARVSPAGAVLDANPFDVAATAASEAQPSVASDGTNWLVAWEVPVGTVAKVRAARVSPACAALDSPALSLSGLSGAQQSPKVAWMGRNSGRPSPSTPPAPGSSTSTPCASRPPRPSWTRTPSPSPARPTASQQPALRRGPRSR